MNKFHTAEYYAREFARHGGQDWMLGNSIWIRARINDAKMWASIFGIELAPDECPRMKAALRAAQDEYGSVMTERMLDTVRAAVKAAMEVEDV